MAQLQATRPITVSTPLGDDVLLFHKMTAAEELGRLFEFKLDLLSTDEQINLEDVLGQAMTVRLDLPSGEERYFNGFVSRFSYTGRYRNFATYEATLRPWLWFLTRTMDCRIFQEKTVPDIIKEVFRGHGFTDFEESLSESYRRWEYCVQYRETDFNFVGRLMEQEGIYYYFKHEEGKHTLVLSDSLIAHERTPGYEQIPYYPTSENAVRERDHIYEWRLSQEVQPGAYVLDDFDFKRPKAELQVKLTDSGPHAASEFEIYDYPGEYIETSEGESYVRARLEELHAQFERVRGEANARGLAVGQLFELTNYPREDQNREYLLVSARHEMFSEPYETTDSSQTIPLYTCHFEAIESQRSYRTPRATQKSVVHGPQTAIVVGKTGEEIWTDEHGRVKVQFHWDREGQYDENSSCWIRVSQVHAGKGFGGVDIPRIGEEVIVEFLEGDPDRPIITGRVYNGDNKPPNSLPGSGMVSGLKSNSTPGGGGDNTIMLDATKGSEKITIHGQYNMDTTVDNDQTNTIANNRTTSIGVDDTETVGGSQTNSVDGDRTETVGGAENITINGARTETVNAGETVTVNGGRSHTVNGTQTTTISVAEMHNVGAGRMHNVGAGEMIDIGGVQAVNVGGAQTISVGGAQAITVGALQTFNVGGPHKLSAAVISETSKGPVKIKAGATAMIEAPTIILKAGGSKIIMNSGGITIKGAKVTVKANGNLTLNGGGGIKLKGPTIGEN